MPCDQTQLVAAYHDGELTPDQAREFAIHLESCPTCRRELDALQHLTQAIAAAPLAQPSGITMARLAAVRRLQDRGTRRLAGALTAAAAVLLVVSLWSDSRRSEPASPLVVLDVVTAAPDEEPPPQTLTVARWMATDLALASAGGGRP